MRRAAPDLAIRGRRADVPLPFHFHATRAGGFETTTLDISRRCTGDRTSAEAFVRASHCFPIQPTPRLRAPAMPRTQFWDEPELNSSQLWDQPELGAHCRGFDSELVELSTRSDSAKNQTMPPARDAIRQVYEPRCGFVRRPITRGVMVGSGLREEWPGPFARSAFSTFGVCWSDETISLFQLERRGALAPRNSQRPNDLASAM